MKSPLIIYGAGGLGREVLSMVSAIPQFEVIGFVDDVTSAGTVIKGVRVLGDVAYLNNLTTATSVVMAIGDPVLKASRCEQISNNLISFPMIKHPSAIIQDPESVKLGTGCILCAGIILTTDIVVGQHVLINLNATVGHDCRIGDFTSIMPGVNLAGESVIGERVLLGSGSCVRNGIIVGDASKVGMGSVVIRDVDAGAVVAGVPAKRLMTKPETKGQS